VLTTITKAGAVLDLFTSERPEWGVSEVADALGTPRPNAHAVLATLVEIGLMRRTADSRYRLGWRLLALSRVLVESVDFRALARRRMARISESSGATLHLAVLDGPQVMYLEKTSGRHGSAIAATGVGLRWDAHCSAVGKVLLADHEPAEAAALLDRAGMARRTARTITSLRDLGRELDVVRVRGYALDDQEGLDGVCCIAAPIRDRFRTVQAAISVSLPPADFARAGERYRRLVQGAAAEVSRGLVDSGMPNASGS
jgi:IclR family KDG regulon transcriptional repressor